MIEPCKNIYENLRRRLHQTPAALSFTGKIEWSFTTCFQHWITLTQQMEIYSFQNTQEEILFFKHTKPLFTSLIEYYNLLYHFQLFKPDHCATKMKTFISLEKNRVKKFKTTNQSFYTYCNKKETHLDSVFFTRMPIVDHTLLLKSYNTNPRLISSHDHLLATLMALEKYRHWLHTAAKLHLPSTHNLDG